MTTINRLNIISYTIVPLALVTFSILIPSRDTFIYYGRAAQFLLIYILFIKPLAHVFNIKWMRRHIAYRRQFGVATVWFALFHALMFIYDRELYYFQDFQGIGNYLPYGAVAIVGMSILGLTSNNYSVRLLKRNWKRVQYLAYPTLFFTLLHSSMARGEMPFVIVVSTLFIILKTLEWKGIKFTQTNTNQ